MTKTIIAFDYGLRNIGVAVGQTISRTASPLSVLTARDGIPNWDQLKALLEEWQPELIVVGLPLNMDGTESELSQRSRKFANRLHGRFGKPVELIDERLSSQEAKSVARSQGHQGNYHDKPIDSLAAAVILQSWFDSEN